MLDHLKPSILVGLTATPERADGKSILHYFDDRIACDLRLWQALDEGLLAPFHYFGINNGAGPSRPWVPPRPIRRRRTGRCVHRRYRASTIIDAVYREVANPASMRALGFCVSVEHARFMAQEFDRAGLPATSVSGESSRLDRAGAVQRLRRGDIRAVFTVDLFNEGIDIPEVDTVLLLRPTESATVFLQQLGRGLRHSPGKSVLTVLDFIGQAHRQYRYDIRYRALVGGTRKQLTSAIAEGFPLTPPGCAIRLDRIAASYVLENVRTSLQIGRQSLVEDLRALAANTLLQEFLKQSGHELDDVYANPGSGHSFTELRRRAGFVAHRPEDATFERAVGRTLHVNDEERLSRWIGWLENDAPPAEVSIDTRVGRLQLMFHAALGQRGRPISQMRAAFRELWGSPVRDEYLDLFRLLLDRSRANTVAVEAHGVVPLHSHAAYGLYEVVAAHGLINKDVLRETREGVIWAELSSTDLLFITLEKSESEYSATTRYQDYPISPTLFHWESQNATSSSSETGRRYIDHVNRGSKVVLFVRTRKGDERGQTAPYVCLGTARYVRHKSERPMRITWALDRAMPPELYQASKVAAG